MDRYLTELDDLLEIYVHQRREAAEESILWKSRLIRGGRSSYRDTAYLRVGTMKSRRFGPLTKGLPRS
jgi:hypothetical protein